MDTHDVDELIEELARLRGDILAECEAVEERLEPIHPNFRHSARNLLHYLALRRHDLRPLQLRLAALGLSSLGRAEANVLATLDAVLAALHGLAGRGGQASAATFPQLDQATGQRLLAEHTETLFGCSPPQRDVRIMVTMPSEAADDYLLVQQLLERGMDCMRINCAHDDPVTWQRMIDHLQRAQRALGRSCRIVMDLGGPKLRTGPIAPGPPVVRFRPRRNVFGRVTAPARVWLTDEDAPRPPPAPADACLPVAGEWLASLRVGERLEFVDARDANRTINVVDVGDGGCWAEAHRTAYVVPGVALERERHVANKLRRTPIGALPPTEGSILLRAGDLLIVTRGVEPGRGATYDSAGRVLTPARVGCTIPQVFDDVHAGEHVWFDDGKIGGVIEKADGERWFVRIVQVRQRGAKLRADRGINLPDSGLGLPALTTKDVEDLTFVAHRADVVELSFANSARDVDELQRELTVRGAQPAIVLKIETRRGFENLPEMLLTAMRSPCCGVMIARGDLAVESGFERLAEVQEETLWICEAAHVPVIWATQVLETLAKEGMPSRAEITDAAMGHRAECVMLNKGPYMTSAVAVLDDILVRMQAHQAKKRSMLRKLHLARMPRVEAVDPSARLGESVGR
jgi:pyruvate kinase